MASPRAPSQAGNAELPTPGAHRTAYAGGHLAACHHPQSVTGDEIAAATRSAASPLSAGSAVPAAA